MMKVTVLDLLLENALKIIIKKAEPENQTPLINFTLKLFTQIRFQNLTSGIVL